MRASETQYSSTTCIFPVPVADPLEAGEATGTGPVGPVADKANWGAVYVSNEGNDPLTVERVRLIEARGVRLQPGARLVRSDVTWTEQHDWVRQVPDHGSA